MTEADLSRAVVRYAELCGWRVMTWRNTKAAGLRSHSALGFPDLILLRRARLIAAELKSEKGKLRPGQQEWLEAFQEAGAQSYIWRPKDWTDGVIQFVLGGSA